MKKIIFIPLLFFVVICSATDYYVRTGGNDASAGTSDGAAWAHHPWMSTWTGSATLVAGDIVYMNRGDTWSIANPTVSYMTVGQSGSLGHYITTTAYGSGAKPIIEVSTATNQLVVYTSTKSFLVFDNLHIKHHSSTYFASSQRCGFLLNNTSHDIIFTNNEISDIPYTGIYGYGDTYNITIGDTSATTTSTISSYSNNVHDCGYAGIIVCGLNPITDTSNFKVYYNYIHDIDKNAAQGNSYGISVGVNFQSSGYPKGVWVKYNYVSDVPRWEGIETHGGEYTYFTDNYIKNCLHGIRTQAADRVGFPGILNYCYVERNTIENTGNSLTGYNYNFIEVVGETSNYLATNCFIRDNEIFYTNRPNDETSSFGISIYNIDGVTISGNKIYNGPTTSAQAINFSSGIIKNVILDRNWINNWAYAVYMRPSYIAGDVSFYDNIFCSDGITFYTQSGTFISGDDLTFYNNVFVSRALIHSNYIYDIHNSSIPTGCSFIFKNNIVGFINAVWGGVYMYLPSVISGTFTCDYNLYYNGSNTVPYTKGANPLSFVAWNAEGYDNNGIINLNPYFTNQGGSYSIDSDFDIGSESPAINQGTDVGLTTDYVDSTFLFQRDIGAYEYWPDNPCIPSTIIINPSNIWFRWAKIVAVVISDGGGTISERGLCWSTSINPTITGIHKVSSGTTGQFITDVTNLLPNTVYHFRAYAINDLWLSYSSDYEVLTPEYGILMSGGNVVMLDDKIYVVQSPAIDVSSIDVFGTGSATTISTNGGTLQMLKKTLPTNAADTTVTWSGTNAVGTVSATGLVIALTNGTVTPRATANDGSAVYGEEEIIITNQGIDYCDEYDAVLAAMTVDPTGDTLTWQNDMVYSIDSAGLWTKTKLFYLLANRNEQGARLDWIDPDGSYNLTDPENTTPLFTKHEGYTGATNDYLSTGWIIANDAAPVSLNSIGAIVWSLTDVNAAYDPLGVTDGGTGALNFEARTSDAMWGRLNSGSNSEFGDPTTTLGALTLTRRGATELEAYHNGVHLGDATDASGALPPTYPLYILARNNAGTEDRFFVGKIAIVVITDGLTDAQQLAYYNILHRYINRIGL